MNRYPLWKYILILVAVLLGLLYTAPNYFGDSPALQVTTGKATVKVNSDTTAQVADSLKRNGIRAMPSAWKARATAAPCASASQPDAQFKAKLALERDLNRDPTDPDYIVTVNLVKNTPAWMQKLRAQPMNLGLDLRGGVHFLLQVDAKAVQETRIKGILAAVRTPAARQERAPCRHRPRRQRRRHQVPRRRHPRQGAQCAGRPEQRPGILGKRRRHRPEAGASPSSRRRCSAWWKRASSRTSAPWASVSTSWA
jgi:hypothetical protein